MKNAKVNFRSNEVLPPKEFFESVYESTFPNVARFIQKSGGMLEDAKDVFHDSLVIYYERVIEGKLKVEKVPEAYILGISKHLWLHKIKKQPFNLQIDEIELMEPLSANSLNEQKLLTLLEAAGKKCLNLLNVFYFGKMNMKHVAVELGYSSDHSATVQKYKCIEKIRTEIKNKSITYEDFFE